MSSIEESRNFDKSRGADTSGISAPNNFLRSLSLDPETSLSKSTFFQPDQRLAGFLVPLFALHGNLGIGNTEALCEAITFAKEHGFGIVQILPIHETGEDWSPYLPVSSLLLNPLHITLKPDAVPGLTQQIFDYVAPQSVRDELNKNFIDYPRVKGLILRILSASYLNFLNTEQQQDSPQAREFLAYQRNTADLNKASLFHALSEWSGNNKIWQKWLPNELTAYESANTWVENAPLEVATAINFSKGFRCYVQWVAHLQWSAVRAHADYLGIELKGDLTFGIGRHSADYWANQNLFSPDWSVGAPPEPNFQGDEFTKRFGQNWGTPLPLWKQHALDNFHWLSQRIQNLSQYFHKIRIDHSLGYFRAYAFPWRGEDNSLFLKLSDNEIYNQTGGRYPRFFPDADTHVRGRMSNSNQGAMIFRAMQQAAGNCQLVAEDLGAEVPNYVRQTLRELGIPGYSLFLNQRDSNSEFIRAEDFPELSVTGLGTHDNPPIIKRYRELVNLKNGPNGHQHWLEMQRIFRAIDWNDNNSHDYFSPELHRAVLDKPINSPCKWAIFNLPDILGTEHTWNTVSQFAGTNWSENLGKSLQEFAADPIIGVRIKMVEELIRGSGRYPSYESSNKII